MKVSDKIRFKIFGHAIMIILTVFALFPMLLLFMSSITDNNSLIRDGYSIFPAKFSMSAYQYIFSTGGVVLRAYGISFLVTAIGTLISVVITTMLAYALSKRGLPGRGLMTFLVFFTMLFNGGLVPTYMNYTNVFGLKNTLWALIIPGLLMNAMNVFMVKSYFVTGVPDEIIEAANIDGASELKVFTSVALPLAKPIIATIALFAGIAYWNDWNNGYIYLTSRIDLFSIQNLLNRMIRSMQILAQSSNISNQDSALTSMPSISIRMAIAVVGILPIIIIYPLLQKNFVKGITLGGVKG